MIFFTLKWSNRGMNHVKCTLSINSLQNRAFARASSPKMARFIFCWNSSDRLDWFTFVKNRFVHGLFVLMLAWLAPCLHANVLSWSTNQYFPTFPTPAATIDCVDVDGLPSDEVACFCSLEGIVNRTQPRMACVS